LDERKLNALADDAMAIYRKARQSGDSAASFLGAIRQVVGEDNRAFALVHRILTNRSAAKAHIASLRGKKTVRRLPPHQYKLRF
jgi:uncharacterized protein YdbL (DUF1318 family)